MDALDLSLICIARLCVSLPLRVTMGVHSLTDSTTTMTSSTAPEAMLSMSATCLNCAAPTQASVQYFWQCEVRPVHYFYRMGKP